MDSHLQLQWTQENCGKLIASGQLWQPVNDIWTKIYTVKTDVRMKRLYLKRL